MKLISFFTLTLFLASASLAGAQIYPQSMQEAAEPSDYEEFLVKEVRRLPEVKKLEDYILYYSPSMKMAIFLVETEGRGIYTVKVMEDNGAKDPLLHLKYTVDSASGKILKTESKKK